MLIDARTLPEGTEVEVDLCIVGGGPAGISVALPFLGTSTSVAILESGGREFDEKAQELAYASASGNPYFPIKETRIRALGGSSMSWGGIHAPLDELDFEKRDWVPESGWPISRSELDPYYVEAKKVSKVLNPDASAAGTEGFFGDEYGPTPATRWSEIYFTPPTRYGKTYAETLEKSRNLSVYLYSTAVEIEANESETEVTGLRVSSLEGKGIRFIAKRYVLAGGGIENARLMLVSGNKERGGLANGNDAMGRYFQEHPKVKDHYRLPENADKLASRVHGAAGTLNFSRLGLSDAVQSNEQLLNYIVNLSFGYAGQQTDQFFAIRRIANASRKPWSDSPYFQDVGGGPNEVRWEDVKTSIKKPHRTIQSVIGAVLEPARMRRFIHIESNVEQLPLAHNRVTITRELDPLGIPEAHLHWTVGDVEEATYRRGRDLIVEALDSYAPGLKDGRMDSSETWPDDLAGCWHHIGTTRMHMDPAKGVVDANCKVHSMNNLYMAGSSVFPTGGATSPTLTIVALGLRLAEHLKQQTT